MHFIEQTVKIHYPRRILRHNAMTSAIIAIQIPISQFVETMKSHISHHALLDATTFSME